MAFDPGLLWSRARRTRYLANRDHGRVCDVELFERTAASADESRDRARRQLRADGCRSARLCERGMVAFDARARRRARARCWGDRCGPEYVRRAPSWAASAELAARVLRRRRGDR